MTWDATALMAAAAGAAKQAYAPYSQFAVGAAALLPDGTVVVGANVENASYGLTVCAERVALLKVVSEGKDKAVALAVWAQTPENHHVTPCGACRQVMMELMSPGSTVIWADMETGQPVESPVANLLPHAFYL